MPANPRRPILIASIYIVKRLVGVFIEMPFILGGLDEKDGKKRISCPIKIYKTSG